MKKILALIGATTLVLNSGVAGFVLLTTSLKDSNKRKSPDGNIVDPPKPPKDSVDEKINKIINTISKIISEEGSANEIINEVLPLLLDNELLASDKIEKLLNFIVNMIDWEELESRINVKISDLAPILNLINTVIFELRQDWAKPAEDAKTPFEAMKKYIEASTGDIAQGKDKFGKWHPTVADRAKKWSWNDFYQYIAGANMNYLVKKLSGKYIGELIDKHLSLGGWTGLGKYGFAKDAFLADISLAFKKLVNKPDTWSYLIKAIVPMLKTEILELSDPTLGITNITWEANNNKDLSLNFLLSKIKHLLSPDGVDDLAKLFSSLLSGSFGEDIIVDLGILGSKTLPRIFELGSHKVIKWILKDGLDLKVISKGFADELSKNDSLKQVANILEEFFPTSESGIIGNPLTDLNDFAMDLNKMYQDNNFSLALENLAKWIENPEKPVKDLIAIFNLLGVQKDQENFKVDSPLAIFKKWVNDPNSMLKQVINRFIKVPEKQII